MKQPRIISLGEVLWDLFPDGERFGGAPANVACHSAMLGGDVSMVSAVGNDKRGQKAIEILKEFGIDTSLIKTVSDTPTGTVGVEMDADGSHRFTIHEDSSWDQLAWTSQLAAEIKSADAVYFGTLSQRSEFARSQIRRALDEAKSAGVLRILDINLREPFFDSKLIRESIALASVLKLSEEELDAAALACEIPLEGGAVAMLRSLVERFDLEAVVMTRGADGALFVTAKNSIEQPGIPAEVVDTVGAGDSFTAVLLVGLLRGEEVSSVLQRACEVASAVCSQPGAIPKISKIPEAIESHLQNI
jgi:fructokinase